MTNKNTNDVNRLCNGIHQIASSRSWEPDRITDDLLLFPAPSTKHNNDSTFSASLLRGPRLRLPDSFADLSI